MLKQSYEHESYTTVFQTLGQEGGGGGRNDQGAWFQYFSSDASIIRVDFFFLPLADSFELVCHIFVDQR